MSWKTQFYLKNKNIKNKDKEYNCKTHRLQEMMSKSLIRNGTSVDHRVWVLYLWAFNENHLRRSVVLFA